MPNFYPKFDIPNMVLVWVCFPHLFLHCWSDDTLSTIRNTRGKFIDKSMPKSKMFACVIICMEVDLEKVFLEVINLSLDN
jgi:hypothetical protein